MKNLIITFVVLIATSALEAQTPNPRLFENDWYLMELTVDGNTIDIPSTSEIGDIELFLTETRIETLVCNGLGTDISDFTNESFTIDTWNMLIFTCNLQSTFDFESLYFEDFLRFGFPVGEVFTYTLVSGPNDTLTLTITNEDGDTAIYGNPALEIEDVKSNTIVLYPNPVSEKLFLQLTTGVAAQEVRVVDIQGRLIHKEIPPHAGLIEIEINSLSSGLYFVQVLDKNGQSSIERFVKE